jgi:membrane protein implicated in regulation of membrane protease activity
VGRVSTPNTKLPLSRPRLAVRLACTLILTAGVVMAGLGMTILSSRLQGRAYVVYWSWCFLLVVAAILLALVDLLLLRRAYRQSRRVLFEREFMTKDFVEQVRHRQKENPKE